MAFPISIDQADQLLSLGKISPDTHALITSQTTPIGGPTAPANDPFAAGASLAGITAKGPAPADPPLDGGASGMPVDAGGGVPGVNMSVAPSTAQAPAPAPLAPIGPPTANGLPPGITDGGGSVTVLAKAQRPANDIAAAAPVTPGPSRDSVGDGKGIPTAGQSQKVSNDPRVNKWWGQWQKDMAPVRQAQDELTGAQEVTLRQEQERDNKLAENADKFAADTAAAHARAEQDDSDYQSNASEQRKRIALAADDAANTKINANRYWQNKGTADKIGSMLGLALGTFGASLSKTPNFALQMMDNDIARDITEQEKNLDNKWKKVDSERGILGDLRQIYGDKRMARADAYKRSYDLTIARGDAIVAASKSPIAASKWEELKAGLEEKKKEHEFDVLQGFTQRAAQLDAAAAAQQAARRKEEREFFMQRYGKTLDASLEEMKKAADDGRTPQPWAIQTAQAASSLGIPMPSGDSKIDDSELGGLSKEQHGKMKMEKAEKSRSAEAQEAQIERMLTSPVTTKELPKTAMLGPTLGGRISEEGGKAAVQLNTLNADMNSMGGKAIKDNEGRIPPAMLEQLHSFNFKSGDSVPVKVQKVKDFQQWLHDRQTETGARAIDATDKGAGKDSSDPYAKYRVTK